MQLKDLSDLYEQHAAGYYVRKDGSQTVEVMTVRQAVRVLREVCGDEPVESFGPKRLKDVRDAMVEKGWARKHINKQCSRVKSMFRWATEEEIIGSPQYQALLCVKGLKAHRTTAPERRPVQPIHPSEIEAIRPHVASPVWAAIQLQRHTAARAAEVLVLRPKDLDMSGEIWEARPSSHKTEHLEQDRILWMGPKAQDAVRPFLRRRIDAPLFSPREAYEERLSKRPPRRIRDHYDTNSYRQAIQRGCDAAGIERWHPHQLRHLGKLEYERAHGAEAARVVMGHRHIKTTALYGGIDRERARNAARDCG